MGLPGTSHNHWFFASIGWLWGIFYNFPLAHGWQINKIYNGGQIKTDGPVDGYQQSLQELQAILLHQIS